MLLVRVTMSPYAAVLVSAAALLPAPAAADGGADSGARGTVVEEAGAPVAGAMVELIGWESRPPESRRLGFVRTGPVRTGPDGGFVLRSDRILLPRLIRAAADGGGRLGFAPSPPPASPLVPADPIRLVLRPSRAVTVRVADADGKPVAGAAVEASTAGAGFSVDTGAVDPVTTDDRGVARFRVPAEAPLQGVLALKDGVGVDYSTGPPPASPGDFSLTLRGPRTVSVRALDSAGRPIPGVTFRLDGLHFGRPLGAFTIRITEVTTDASGIARWRWVPERSGAQIRAIAPEDLVAEALPSLSILSEGDATFNVLFRRGGRLSGRVVNADGTPARGVTVSAAGMGKAGEGARIASARTGEDGSYTMVVRPDRSHLIAVTSPGHASMPISDVPIGEGERHAAADFVLSGGTRLHGRVAARLAGWPYVQVHLLGEELPADRQERSGAKDRLRLPVPAKVDNKGNYEARLGPGDYEVKAPAHRGHPTIRVDGQGEFLLDFLSPPVALSGVVVEPVPGGGERPAMGRVTVVSANSHTDARIDGVGRFTTTWPGDDAGLYVTSENGVAAVKVAEGTKEVKVVLGPPATLSGRVVDAKGRPLVGEGPRMRMIDGPGGLPRPGDVTYLSRSGPDGRYQFKGLIPGAEYRVFFLLFRDSGAQDNIPIKTLRVPGPGPIELGEFVVPAERP